MRISLIVAGAGGFCGSLAKFWKPQRQRLAKIMALKEHMNNCARLAQPGIWIFRGKAMVLLVIGFALFHSDHAMSACCSA